MTTKTNHNDNQIRRTTSGGGGTNKDTNSHIHSERRGRRKGSGTQGWGSAERRAADQFTGVGEDQSDGWEGIRVRVGEGAPAGSYKAGGVVWAGAGSLGRGRSLPTVGRRGGGAGRPLEWPGRNGPRSFWWAMPCRPAGRTGGPSTAWCTGRAWPGPGDFGPVPCLGRAGSSVLGPG